MEHIPLLVRAGTVLPMAVKDTLRLHIYPPSSSRFVNRLYSDEGDGYGPWRMERFDLSGDQGSVRLHWRSEEDFPFPYKGIEVHFHGSHVSQATLDGVERAVEENKIALSSPFRELLA